MILGIKELVDDRLYYEKIRELRSSAGVSCPHCQNGNSTARKNHNSLKNNILTAPIILSKADFNLFALISASKSPQE
jgi:hypothetical protein